MCSRSIRLSSLRYVIGGIYRRIPVIIKTSLPDPDWQLETKVSLFIVLEVFRFERYVNNNYIAEIPLQDPPCE